MADNIKSENAEKSRKKKRIIAIVASAAALCLIVAVVLLLLLRPGDEDQPEPEPPVSSSGGQTGGEPEGIPEEPAEPEEPFIPPIETPEKPEELKTPSANETAGDEATLRELLLYEGDINITLTDDISVGAKLDVAGNKQLSGKKTLSYLMDGMPEGYIVDVLSGASLIVNGPTFDGQWRSSGIHVGDGANLSFESGTVHNVSNYCVHTDGAEATITGGTFRDTGFYGVYAEGTSKVFIEDGTFARAFGSFVFAATGAYVSITGNPVFTEISGAPYYAAVQGGEGSTMEIHGGVFDGGYYDSDTSYKGTRNIIYSAGRLDISPEKDGYLKLHNFGGDAVRGGANAQITLDHVYAYDVGGIGFKIWQNGKIEITNCKVEDTGGEGLELTGPGVQSVVKNVTIGRTGKTSIRLSGNGEKVLENIVIEDSKSSGITVYNETDTTEPGAVKVKMTDVTINGGGGVGINLNSCYTVDATNLTVKNYNGGGADVTGVLNCTNGEFSGNGAVNGWTNKGSGIKVTAGGSVNLTGVLFDGNNCVSATGGAGALYVNAGTGVLTDCEFTNNKAGYVGAAVTVENGSKLELKKGDGKSGRQTRFYNNYAQFGGAIFAATDTTVLNITGYTFEKNSALNAGGALRLNTGTITLTDCPFISNTVIGQSGNAYSGDGGAIWSGGANVTIVTTSGRQVFRDNHASRYGGAIHSYGTTVVKNYDFDANGAGQGGAVLVDGGDFTGTNLGFANNTSGGVAGAVWMRTGVTPDVPDGTPCSLTLLNDGDTGKRYSVFDRNRASSNGGAVMIENGSARISGYKFSANTSTEYYGGAICVTAVDGAPNPPDTIVIENCEFTGNTSERSGGALRLDKGNVKITGADFAENRCLWKTDNTRGGGALSANGAAVTCEDCDFTGNTAVFNGGAVRVDAGSFTAKDSSFTKNGVDDGNGGGDGGAIWNAATITLEGAGGENRPVFDGNTAKNYGGAIYSTGTAEIKNYDFKNNEGGQAGAVCVAGGAFTGTNLGFEKNTTKNLAGAVWVPETAAAGVKLAFLTDGEDARYAVFDHNTAGNNGGAFMLQKGTARISGYKFNGNSGYYGGAICVTALDDVSDALVIENCEFTGNTSAKSGGALRLDKGNVKVTGSKFTENKSLYEASNADANGHGGGAISGNGATVTCENCEFTRNTAVIKGGAVRADSGSVTVKDSSFAGNGTTGTDTKSSGGTIYTKDIAFTCTNCSFDGSSAWYVGGIACVEGTGTLTLNKEQSDTAKDCKLANGTAQYGGAVFLSGTAKLNVTGYTFENNSAQNAGGALEVNVGTTVTVTECGFNSNSVTKGGNGGAIWNGGATVTATDCEFSMNRAAKNGSNGFGGAISNENAAAVTNLTRCGFTLNIAEFCGGAVYLANGTVNGINCSFESNSSGNIGGAIYIPTTAGAVPKLSLKADNDPEYAKCRFFNNSSNNGAYNGGAIEMTSGSAEIDGYKFEGNSGFYGGAICVSNMSDAASSPFTIKNCLFTGNTAGNSGGALCGDNGKFIIENTAFTKNTAAAKDASHGGGAVCAQGAEMQFTNCPFTDNESKGIGGAIRIRSINSSTSKVTLTGDPGNKTKFSGNKSAKEGGAVHAAAGTLTITNYAFENNTSAAGSHNTAYTVGCTVTAGDGVTGWSTD